MQSIIEKDRDFCVINVSAENVNLTENTAVVFFKNKGVEYTLSFLGCVVQPEPDKTNIFVIARCPSGDEPLFGLIAVDSSIYNMFSKITPIESRANAIKCYLDLSAGERNNILLQRGDIKWTRGLEVSSLRNIVSLQVKRFLCKETLPEQILRLYNRALESTNEDFKNKRPINEREYLDICFSNVPDHHLSEDDLKVLEGRVFLPGDRLAELRKCLNHGGKRILIIGTVSDAESISKELANVLSIPYSSRDIGSFHAGFELLGDKSVWNKSRCNVLTEMLIETQMEASVLLLNSIDALGSSREHGSAKKALRKLLDKSTVYDPFYNINIPISSSIIICSAEDKQLVDQATLNSFDCVIDTSLNDGERLEQAKKYVHLNHLCRFTDDALARICDYSIDMADLKGKLEQLSSGHTDTITPEVAEQELLKSLPTDPYKLFRIYRSEYPVVIKNKVSELHSKLLSAESRNEFTLAGELKNKLDLLYTLKRHSKPAFDMDEFIKLAAQRHIGHEKVISEIAEFFNYAQALNEETTMHAYFLGDAGCGKSDLGEAIGICSNMSVVRIDMPAVGLDELTGANDNHKVPTPSILTKALSKGACVFLFEEFEKARNEIQNFCLRLLDCGHTFHDHYLDIDISLEGCLFIATANGLPNLKCMLDRFRVFKFSPYNSIEKAKLLDWFAGKSTIAFDSAAKAEILYRCGGGSARPIKRAVERLSEHAVAIGADTVNTELVNNVLGESPPIYTATGEKHIGVVNCLAVNAEGGFVTQAEALTFSSSCGVMEVTGYVDDDIKEAALTGKDYLLGHGLIDECRIHLHYTNAYTKGGNSSGIAMTLGIYSAYKKLAIPDTVAFTGEISLSGRVLPVGGIPEKIEGAIKSGIKKVFIPSSNFTALKSSEENAEYFERLSSQIDITPVETFYDILNCLSLS